MERNHFRVVISEKRITISVITEKYNHANVTLIIKDIENNQDVHRNTLVLNREYNYWFMPEQFDSFKGFIVEIYHEDVKVFEETNRLRNIPIMEWDNVIKKQCLFIDNISGMGDTFFAEPLIRKVSKSYEQKIIVFTYYPQLFINHPCIDKLINVETHHRTFDISKNIPEEYLNKDLYNVRYVLRWERDIFGIIPHWTGLDLRQYAAFHYGITLKPDELNYHFYPDDFIPIEGLPEKYVVINPSITGPDRTWTQENWQKLIDTFNEKDISIVAIGKEVPPLKGFFDLNIKKGLNLCGDDRQDSLSQAWHIINKSDMFISFDNGLFTLAGSTDTFLLQIGGSSDPIFHQPYRNSDQYYKFKHVCGDCKLMCQSDPKCTVQYLGYFGSDKEYERLGVCFYGYKEYKCHPKAELIIEESLKILKP